MHWRSNISCTAETRRLLTIPLEVDEKKINATYKNGVLTITLLKSQKAKEKATIIKIE